jgi:sensor histidine kinase YesM
MSVHNFIFSSQRNYRIQRHVLLWITCYLFMIIIYPPRGSGNLDLGVDGFLKFYEMVMIRAFVHLLGQVIFCYPLLYFLMPAFFWKKRYLLFICLLILLWIAVAFARYAVFNYAYNPLIIELKLYQNPAPFLFIFGLHQTISGPAFIGLIFIFTKVFKEWQKKQKDNLSLQKENTNAELQLLKAQIHPHFLFNTLNNIYSFALSKSAKAGEMVLQLSDVMKYMINDCETEFVNLDKELKMMNDYIGLERVRYGERLNMQVEIIGDNNDKIIAPLLMIPFLENSFKHGASKLIKEPWVKLFIQVDEEILHFTLINNKPIHEVVNSKGGIGLANVKKRLELLYPKKHLLLIEETENTFTVNMQVPFFVSSAQPAKQHVYAA